MKSFILVILMAINSYASAVFDPLIGRWDYVGFHYQGHYFQKPNPDLHVIFEFDANQHVKLTWIRDDDHSHCNRIADYAVNQGVLRQTIIWVDPDNSYGCSSDPDMTLGKTSETPYQVHENKLNLYLSLNGEELVYVLDRL